MSNTIDIITLVINAIDLLIVIMQVCLPWARGARCEDNNNQDRRIKEAEAGDGPDAQVSLLEPGTWTWGGG